jgi:hypothetical protein
MGKTIKQINEELEALQLYEISMAWNSKQSNRCVWVENPSGHNNKYFKYLNGITYGKADKCARISMLRPEYVEHKDYDRKNNWILNSSERKELVTLMQEPNKKYPGCNNWQATIITYNEDNFGIDFDETINDSFDKELYPDAFSINTPMPNYKELK